MKYALLLLVTIVFPTSADGILRYGDDFASEASCEAHRKLLLPHAAEIAQSTLPAGVRFRDPHFECRKLELGEPAP